MSSYRDRTAWLSTKHQKLGLIAPAMLEHAGLKVNAVEVETDVLGTFSGETKRPDTPLNTAIAKAKLGLDQTGETLGIASEGSIGPDPQNPFLISDIETVVLVDLAQDLVIHESHRSFEIVAASKEFALGDDLAEFLGEIDFPNHRVIARVSDETNLPIHKGIDSEAALARAIAELTEASQGKKVLVETDFRAHQSPSRQKNIVIAAQRLARRIASNCPSCDTAGFGVVRYQTGLSCEQCGVLQKDAIAREMLCCIRCERVEPGKVIAHSVPAERCDWCNP